MPPLPETAYDRPLRIAMLLSGGGTTLDNFMKKIVERQLDAKIAVVVSSREDCVGNEKARTYQIPLEVCDRSQFGSVADFSEAVFSVCREHQVDLVIMGGFLCLVQIPEDFEYRVMNIHPSLIPAFCGKGFHGSKVHQSVYDRGSKVSGCTVHFADNQYDHGPIIVQRAVALNSNDGPDEIAHKVFEQECEAYPEAVRLFAQGKLRLNESRVEITDGPVKRN